MITGENHYSQKRKTQCETFFAPAERATQLALEKNVQLVTSNAIANTLLTTVSGLLAILNRERQILALNTSLLTSLGVDDASEVLGLRPGEAINSASP